MHDFTNILITITAVAIILLFRLSVGHAVKKKYGRFRDYQGLTNLFSGVFTICAGFFILFIWNVPSLLMGVLTPLGTVGVILLFTMKDMWISDLLVGVSTIGEKTMSVGQVVKIDHVEGQIVDRTLTAVTLQTEDGHLVRIPNRKFKEGIVTFKNSNSKKVVT